MADTDTPAAEKKDEKLEQTVTIDDIGPARKKITIEIPQSRIEDAIGDSYERLRDDAVVPGFRRGRTPQRLIEKRFGTAVRDDVRGQIISESYSQAIEEEDIRVIGEPDVKDFDDIRRHSTEAAHALDDYLTHHGWWATEDAFTARPVRAFPDSIIATISAMCWVARGSISGGMTPSAPMSSL